MENDTDARERLFHNAIREVLIHFLFFLILYVFAYLLISKFKKKKEYYFAEDDEDAIVYRISLHASGICSSLYGAWRAGDQAQVSAGHSGRIPLRCDGRGKHASQGLHHKPRVGDPLLCAWSQKWNKWLCCFCVSTKTVAAQQDAQRTRMVQNELRMITFFRKRVSRKWTWRSPNALQQLASPWRRNLGYPLAMLALLSLTIISLLMVIHNTLQLLIGIKALPVSPQVEQFSLGISSLSALGVIGSSLEIVLILYLWLASVVGFFTLPMFCRLRPKPSSATLTQIIGNCAVLLVLSSALPVLARTLDGDYYVTPLTDVLLTHDVAAPYTVLCITTNRTCLPLVDFSFIKQVLPEWFSIVHICPLQDFQLEASAMDATRPQKSAPVLTTCSRRTVHSSIASDLPPEHTDALRRILKSSWDIW
ncbi:limb region 1 homolog-like protein isoform X10 [Dermacentor albipictus]|uniref:limb region 1 homolog-like protein isoform X10 n=1 Tax=Dermacentor albipictus TaxID=60249 RepID=UPI0038FD01AA